MREEENHLVFKDMFINKFIMPKKIIYEKMPNLICFVFLPLIVLGLAVIHKSLV